MKVLRTHEGSTLNVGVTPEELCEVMSLVALFICFPKMPKSRRWESS